MGTKKAAPKKVAKKPVKRAVKKLAKKTVKRSIKKVVKKPVKIIAVKVLTENKKGVIVTSVDDPGSATEGESSSVKPYVDSNGVVVMVPINWN